MLSSIPNSKNKSRIGITIISFLLVTIIVSCQKEMSYEKRSRRDYKLMKLEIDGKTYELESKKICWNKEKCGYFGKDYNYNVYNEGNINGITWSTFFLFAEEKKKDNPGINKFGFVVNFNKESKQIIKYSTDSLSINIGSLSYDKYNNYLELDSITEFTIKYWDEKERYFAADMVLSGHNSLKNISNHNIKVHFSTTY